MIMLTAAAQSQPDYVALAMVIALAVFVFAAALRKRFAKRTIENEEPQTVAQRSVVLAPGSAGQLKLHNVEPKTAAMIMAIVANKMGKPLNELRFISIKEVTEEGGPHGYSL